MTGSISLLDAPITLIGHPFAANGMGEQMRSHISACRSVHLPHAARGGNFNDGYNTIRSR
jgi:hypothetical protein